MVLLVLAWASHCRYASYPDQPNCEIGVFQVGWRLAADFHFRPRMYFGVDDDFRAGSPRAQKPRGYYVTMHRSADSSAHGVVQIIHSGRKEGKSPTDGRKKASVQAGATRWSFVSWGNWCTPSANGNCCFANMETHAGFSPMASGDLSMPLVMLEVPNGESRLTVMTLAVLAVG